MNSDILKGILDIKQTVIYHPCFNHCLEEIKVAHELSSEIGIPRNILCVGDTGVGKTTLKNELKLVYPDIQKEDRVLKPVLCVDVPSKPTLLSLTEAMLIALGDNCYYRKGSSAQKTERIKELIKKLEVKTVVVDEFQHFVDQGNKKTPNEAADWLKSLIESSNVSAVLMGLPQSKIVLDVNKQLRRRFSRHLELKSFDLMTQSNMNTFVSVLMKLDMTLQLPQTITLDQDLVHRIYIATNGVIDYMVKLLLSAYEYALSNGYKKITIEALDVAFSKSIWREGKGYLNPFNSKFDLSNQRLKDLGMPFYDANPFSEKVAA